MIGDLALDFLVVINYVVLVYFVVLNAVYLLTGVLAFRHLRRYVQRLQTLSLDELSSGTDALPITLLVPAFNEDATIADVVRSFLTLGYPQFEVVVVNDGSTDATLECLLATFEMGVADRMPSSDLGTAPVRGVYRGRRHRNLWVIDKDNGGKPDAVNAGLNYCRTPLFCVVDADTLLEPGSLTRAVRPFLEDTRTIATGGIIRVANGCTVRSGLVDEVRLPRSLLARLQVLEYLRAFLAARMGWDALNATLIISGAFGAFRRSVVVDVGGYATDTVGEDMELVVRLHRHCREGGIPYRITFIPDPIAWTQCPEDLATLGRQRDRWQRGLTEVLTRHRLMLFNPRYGRAGTIAHPYHFIFEMIGPGIELLGYAAFLLGVILGVLSLEFVLAFLALALVLGVGMSFVAVGLEELSFRRYASHGDFARLMWLSFADAFGYRQLQTFWRVRGLVSHLRGTGGWEDVKRQGFGPSLNSEVPSYDSDGRSSSS